MNLKQLIQDGDHKIGAKTELNYIFARRHDRIEIVNANTLSLRMGNSMTYGKLLPS